MIFHFSSLKGGGSDTKVTWEDQQNINKFRRLNNPFHELEDEIKIAKITIILCFFSFFFFIFVYLALF
ncbi:hypothetical protein AHAS_Ahas11G0243000 [Arachis hypogaea]